jgi:hypothetical protein
MITRLTCLSFVSVVSLLAACGDDPLSYSAPVGINLKAKSSDTVNNVVTDDKNITTESGNPYGAFVADARRELGRDPGSIDVDQVELLLGAGSTGVTRLGEVFTGNVEVLLEMADTNNTYVAASGEIAAATTGGPVTIDSTFAADDVPDLDYAKLLSGSFKVVLRGPAATGFATKGADAEVQVTLTFAAYE